MENPRKKVAQYPSLEKRFRDFIEDLKSEASGRDRIAIILNSPGGSAETVEKLVDIVRYHYSEIHFVIPDEAMSAGTIFALSGDKIFMDYTSSLGPIDPQVHNGKDWVPALGYLDQVEKMIKKSADGTLADAELVILQNLDLAMLSRYEQAKNLTITLLKKWLVDYKFRDWTTHQSNPQKLGQPVTDAEKQIRAEEIAILLSDNKSGIRTVEKLEFARCNSFCDSRLRTSRKTPIFVPRLDHILNSSLTTSTAMTTHSSSIVADTSEIAESVNRALREATDVLSDERAAHLSRLRGRIRDLERRGFIKRQEFKSPTTGEFERRFACLKKG